MKTRKHFSSVPGERIGPVSLNGKNILDCVLFDWGGTPLASFEADAQAHIRMFAALGVKRSMAELKRQYSPNWRLPPCLMDTAV
jgi:hypothetical protein